MDNEINIIGSGPIGSYFGFLISKKGRNTNIFEKKSKIGVPIQCTGLITENINDLIPNNLITKSLVNKTRKAIIFGKQEVLEVKTTNYVINREKFDNILHEMAADAGAKIYLNHKFLGIKKDTIVIENNGKKLLKKGIIVGADGPMSKVRKYVDKKRVFNWTAYQAVARASNLDKKTIEFYPTTGVYAWVVPENEEIARIGVITNNKNVFKKLLEMKNAKPLSYTGGLIPRYDPKMKLNKKNIFLIGDAACQVKATTGGGIVPGLSSAKLLAECITENKDYEKLFRKTIGKELLLHLTIRRILDRLNENDYDKLIKAFNSKDLKHILENTTRDNLRKALPKLIWNSPKLMFLAKKIL